jgi:hypothetical protein
MEKDEIVLLFISPSKTNAPPCHFSILYVLTYLCNTCPQNHVSSDVTTIYFILF